MRAGDRSRDRYRGAAGGGPRGYDRYSSDRYRGYDSRGGYDRGYGGSGGYGGGYDSGYGGRYGG